MKMKSEEGFALITVMWMTMILSVIALSILAIGKTQRALTNNELEFAKAELAAEAAINYAISELASRRAVQRMAPGINKLTYEFDGRTIFLEIFPEEGKLDLNTSDPALISGLLAFYGVSDNQAISIADALDQRRKTSNAKFYTVDEILSISDFPREKYNCLKPYLTVHNQTVGVDLSMAHQRIKDLVIWLDETRWNDRNWINTDGTSIGGSVSNMTRSTARVRSYSGKAFTIQATTVLKNDIRLVQTSIARITGNLRESYWVYVWESGYGLDETGCTHL